MDLEQKIFDIEEEVAENRKNVEKLSQLQTKHEHLDEIRAVKQDQLTASIQTLVKSLENYQSELHELALKNLEDNAKQDVVLAQLSTRVKILYAACAIIGGAILTGVFTFLPQLLGKGK